MPSPASSSPSPLPPPAPSAARRRRRRQLLPPSSSSSTTTPTSTSATSSSGSSSSSSSASSGALSFFSPAPSPFNHRFLSPLRSSAVPFSWEHRPGIPKTPARQLARAGKNPAAPKALPLPPSLLSSKVGAADDPFVVSADDATGDYFIVPEDAKTARRRRSRMQRRRRPQALAATLTDWLAVLSLYGSCTRSRDCLAATPALTGESRSHLRRSR
ncbi:hypothetical protein QOZ80_4AG0317210 [Eleusine coracana subsp. coracana]|nr:hypothetical protein QOZ80_4AG0317210 [Eleusine coracana subsp. coracana]